VFDAATLQVDPAAPEPPFEQVRRGIAEQAAAGILRPGTRLPTVRGLAAELGLAAGTVARAYKELEADGVIETRGRNGTVVRTPGEERDRLAVAAARDYVDRLRRLGVPDDRIVELIRDALED